MAPMPTYRHGQRVDAIDRDGASLGLDRLHLLSSRSSPSSSVVSSTRPSHQPTDLQGQSPLTTSTVQRAPVDLQGQTIVGDSGFRRTPNYLYGPGTLLNVRSHSRARRFQEGYIGVEESRPTSRDDSHAYTASENIRPLRRARPLHETYSNPSCSRPLLPGASQGNTYLNDSTFPQDPPQPPSTPPRKDSATHKLLRRSLSIRRTTSVSVKSEPASQFVKSSGSNVFVERGEFDDGNLYAGTSRDRYKYSVKVWADRKGKGKGRVEMKEKLDGVVGEVIEGAKRGWTRVKSWMGVEKKRGKEGGTGWEESGEDREWLLR